ncbi:MAG TPA: PxKF domain-containing protein [Pedococcus sp.]|nr:PxKF domain-containing protein [Pedococcus sp.]
MAPTPMWTRSSPWFQPGGSSLQYDAATGTYTYVWKSDKAWAGSCRQLVVKLDDGTLHRANFKFTKT